MNADLNSWLTAVWDEKQRTGKAVDHPKIYENYERTVDPAETSIRTSN
jgi:hypothetical protein